MEILIISGLSGAGKSKAASFLEDSGFYIRNPAAAIPCRRSRTLWRRPWSGSGS